MRQSLKIAISLLASLLLFAGFAVVSFSGLFDVLQVSFFLPGIERAYQSDLASLAAAIERFHAANLEAYRLVASKDFVSGSFVPALSDATIKAWSETAAQLVGVGMRLVGSDGRRIVYSTLDLDVKQRAAGSLAFKNYNEDGTELPAEQLLVAPGGSPRILNDGARGRFIYCVPVSSGVTEGVRQTGTLAFYLPANDLLSRLAFSGGFPVDKVSLVENQGILINGPAASKTVKEALVSIWQRNAGSPSFASSLSLTSPDGTTAGYRVFSARLSLGGVASILVPNSRFEMTEFMKGLLLATFFLTVFLLLYLIFNLRSDPLEVLRQRVKRFQIQLVTELVGSPGGADWGRLRRELEARKDEITWQIQRGIGRVPPRKKPVIDEYMTKSWGEVLDLISRRVETPGAPAAAMDFSRLEALIKTALQNANFALPAPRQVPSRGPPAASAATSGAAPSATGRNRSGAA